MAALSYTLYDYARIPADLVAVDPTVATSDATFVLSTNGPFPYSWWLNDNGDWEGGELDGSLSVSIDGYDIGGVFLGPPGMDTHGYFEPNEGNHSGITATIPRDIWRAIIADGEMQVEYRLGLDAESLARADDYIRLEVNWLESYNGVRGSPDGDLIVVDMPTIIEGRGGNDDITGSSSGDIIMGGAGNDLLDGAGGQDTIRGGDGVDTISGGSGDDVILGGAERDLAFGNEGSDRIRGDAGNDDLDGSGGNDVLWGGDGNDRLLGRTGNNHLFGGSGADEFIFSHTDGEAIQHVYDFDRTQGDTLVYIHSFDDVIDFYDIRVGKDGTVLTIADATIILSGVFDLTSSDIVFQADSNWPLLAAAVAAPPFDVTRGTDGPDIIGTGDDPDYLSGRTGNDELWSGGGDDTIVGGADQDQLWGQAGNDTLRGEDGIDNLTGGQGDDLLWGGNGRDYLFGEEGTDRLRGEAGNDDLSGWDGTDYLWGGADDDRLWGGLGANHLWGGAGADQFMFHFSDNEGVQRIYDFNRSEGDRIVYGPDWDQIVDDIDVRTGKDGSVVTIGDTTIVVSGVLDLTTSDITVISDGYWPWEV